MLKNATAPEEIVLHSEGEVKVWPMELALTWMFKALFLGNLATLVHKPEDLRGGRQLRVPLYTLSVGQRPSHHWDGVTSMKD